MLTQLENLDKNSIEAILIFKLTDPEFHFTNLLFEFQASQKGSKLSKLINTFFRDYFI